MREVHYWLLTGRECCRPLHSLEQLSSMELSESSTLEPLPGIHVLPIVPHLPFTLPPFSSLQSFTLSPHFTSYARAPQYLPSSIEGQSRIVKGKVFQDPKVNISFPFVTRFGVPSSIPVLSRRASSRVSPSRDDTKPGELTKRPSGKLLTSVLLLPISSPKGP